MKDKIHAWRIYLRRIHCYVLQKITDRSRLIGIKMPTAIVIDKYQKHISRKKNTEKMKEAYWNNKVDVTLSTLVK